MIRKSVWAAMLAAMFLIGAALAPVSAADPGRTNGRIAFGTRGPDGFAIQTIMPNGTGLTTITSGVGFHLCADYTPDGQNALQTQKFAQLTMVVPNVALYPPDGTPGWQRARGLPRGNVAALLLGAPGFDLCHTTQVVGSARFDALALAKPKAFHAFLCGPQIRILDASNAAGWPGCLGSLDCVHWAWKNCPSAYMERRVPRKRKAMLQWFLRQYQILIAVSGISISAHLEH